VKGKLGEAGYASDNWETDEEPVVSFQVGQVGTKEFKDRIERTWN
jgi:hypothetical protein